MQAWEGVHSDIDAQIQFIGERAHRDVLAKLRLSFELFRDEVGTHLNCLMDVKEQLDGGVNYMPKASDCKLIASTERSDMIDNVISEIFAVTQK